MAGPGDVQDIHVQHLLNVLGHRLVRAEGWLNVRLGRWLAAGQGQEEQGNAQAVGDAQAVVGDVHAVMGDVHAVMGDVHAVIGRGEDTQHCTGGREPVKNIFVYRILSADIFMIFFLILM